MKAILDFIKTTLVGGVLVVLPAWVSALLLLKGLGALTVLLKPIIDALPKQAQHPRLLALLILVVGCFAVGLLIKTAFGRTVRSIIEQHVLARIPGYTVIRSFSDQFAQQDEAKGFAPALVEIEEALVPAFIIERHADGRCTAFVPSAPTPMMGSIYILTPERVHPINVSMAHAMRCVTKWGEGSGELIAKMHDAPLVAQAPHEPHEENRFRDVDDQDDQWHRGGRDTGPSKSQGAKK